LVVTTTKQTAIAIVDERTNQEADKTSTEAIASEEAAIAAVEVRECTNGNVAVGIVGNQKICFCHCVVRDLKFDMKANKNIVVLVRQHRQS
jgi:hypothetical protein